MFLHDPDLRVENKGKICHLTDGEHKESCGSKLQVSGWKCALRKQQNKTFHFTLLQEAVEQLVVIFLTPLSHPVKFNVTAVTV